METEEKLIYDYRDGFSLKETAQTKLVPKYFPDIELNKLNIGLTGYVTELIGNGLEDTFNTQSMLLKESWVNRAQIPENIYSHAAIFQLDNLFSRASRCQFGLFMTEEAVRKYGTMIYSGNDTFYQLYIDGGTQLLVEGITFTLDYDIMIKGQYNASLKKWIYSAQYLMTESNSISEIVDPYIPVRAIAGDMIILHLFAHQCTKTTVYENLITNSKINFPILEFNFTDKLAGFDVFYKSPGADKYTQLKKLIMYSSPIKNPFCYYKITDEDKFVLTFNTRDSYFQPEFNSDIMVRIYTTDGDVGNFDPYQGDDCQVVPISDKYENNGQFAMNCRPMGPSSGGMNALSMTALQSLTVENYSTAKSITTENDLSLFFNNYKYRYGNEMFFMKKRDDNVARLFSSFCLFKKDDFIYPTNTLHINMTGNDITPGLNDSEDHFIIEPGRLFTYIDDTSRDTLKPIKEADIKKGDLVFTNPFMISLTRVPELCGYYMNIVNQTCGLKLEMFNETSFLQFIMTNININRSIRSKDYMLKTAISPSIESEDIYITDAVDMTKNLVRVVCVTTTNYTNTAFTELKPDMPKQGDIGFTFHGKITTNDSFNTANLFGCTNLTVMGGLIHDLVHIPMIDSVLRLYVLVKEVGGTNIFTEYDKSFADYKVVNIYNTSDFPITFIKPMNMMRSVTTIGEGRNTPEQPIPIRLYDIPMIRQDIIYDEDRFGYFVQSLTGQYLYMEEVLKVLNNNKSIDIKFYNTYGRSKNFFIGDDKTELDTVQLSIKLKFKFIPNTDEVALIENLKVFIKKYIERVNGKGTNDIYVSNLTREIENNFPKVRFLKFIGFNNYSSNYQSIYTKAIEFKDLTKDERMHYVPEMLVVDTKDISISTYA